MLHAAQRSRYLCYTPAVLHLYAALCCIAAGIMCCASRSAFAAALFMFCVCCASPACRRVTMSFGLPHSCLCGYHRTVIDKKRKDWVKISGRVNNGQTLARHRARAEQHHRSASRRRHRAAAYKFLICAALQQILRCRDITMLRAHFAPRGAARCCSANFLRRLALRYLCWTPNRVARHARRSAFCVPWRFAQSRHSCSAARITHLLHRKRACTAACLRIFTHLKTSSCAA
jgi:hypothetical protein